MLGGRREGGAPLGGLAAYHEWIIGTALPFWATAGFDAAAGRFRERLDGAGAPLPVPHRAMVQARQIYVCSHAHQLGWLAEGGALAERAMAGLVRDFGRVDGGEASFAFSVDPGSGRTVSDVRHAYAHAFVLFATAWLYRVTGDRELLRLAERVNAFIKARLVDPAHGGVFDALPVAAREKRQNPLMHLLEAYLALERAAPGRGYLEDARGLVTLFRRRLVDARHGVLLEYFAEDWAPPADAARAGLFEPGHHYEWVWLLGEYAALAGEGPAGGDLGDVSDRLYDVARARGHAADGLVFDELAVGDDGVAVRTRSHRVWPHTEAIKAAAARHARGDGAALPFAHAMAGALLDRFLDRPFAGGWVDHVDGADAPVPHRPRVDYVPASSLYHLFFAAAEAARVGPAGVPAALPAPAGIS